MGRKTKVKQNSNDKKKEIDDLYFKRKQLNQKIKTAEAEYDSMLNEEAGNLLKKFNLTPQDAYKIINEYVETKEIPERDDNPVQEAQEDSDKPLEEEKNNIIKEGYNEG